MKAAYSDLWKRLNSRNARRWSLSHARLRERKIVMANWTASTPFWGSATNQANPMWLPAMMSTSHDRLLGEAVLRLV